MTKHTGTGTYTISMERRIRRAAREAGLVTIRNASVFFDGQWRVENVHTGAQWSVCDAGGPGAFNCFCFEQVTRGEQN